MNIDSPTQFIKNISIIIAVVIGGWWAILGIFATQEMLLENKIEDIRADIDTNEKWRNHYTAKMEDGVKLDKYESRRLESTKEVLDRLYDDLSRKEDQLAELSKNGLR
jgi:Tfp pilus assembly protein PilO